MELQHTIDSVAFFKTIDSCRGEILLHTKEQDVLNLRSQLCRFIFAVAFSEGSFLEGAWVECADPGDYALLRPYLKEGGQAHGL